MSAVVRQLTKRQYECKDLFPVSPSHIFPTAFTPPRFTRDLKETPHTSLIFSLSLSCLRKTRRHEVHAQLRGCNPRYDETSIVITELSGKPPLQKQPRRMQTAYLLPIYLCTYPITATAMTRHVPETRKLIRIAIEL